MTADIKLLPLPEELKHRGRSGATKDYARANVEAATAKLQAEIEALRVEVETAKGQVEFYRTERNKNQRKAERLAEALREDGARLDWLADQMRITDLHFILDSVPLDPSDLRAAIDAAREARNG